MPVFRLSELPARADVLLDSNIIIYGLSRSSPECVQALDKCRTEEVHAYVTAEVVSELCHRLMVTEAWKKGIISRPNAGALRAKIAAAKPVLREYWPPVEQFLLTGNVSVMPLDELRLSAAHALREEFPLLTNDSLILAAASQYGVTTLISGDADFSAVPWLSVYRPADMPTS